MRTPVALFSLALLAAPASAHDEESPWYLSLGLGAVTAEDASNLPASAGGNIGFDPGFSVSAALGYRLTEGERLGLAIEGEAYYEALTVDEKDLPAIPSATNDDVKSFSFLANGVAHWHFTPQVAAYASAGIGIANTIEYDSWNSGGLVQLDDNGVVYQARVGLAYSLGAGKEFMLGYRYFQHEALAFEDQNTSTSFEIDAARHSIEAGVRWTL
jgi:opacity protein-like surface antigen